MEAIAAHDAAERFDELGLPAPQAVPTLPLTHQSAQKLLAAFTLWRPRLITGSVVTNPRHLCQDGMSL